MNFGGGSGNNPPWARQQGGGSNYGYSAGNAYQAQQHLSQPGLAMPTSLSGPAAASNYPSSRSASQQSAAGGAVKQRVFTGTITKVSDNFGFVDEDVFFQTSVCKGGVPKMSDRVLVEATYNANMPFKWNATRVQIIVNAAAAAPVPPQAQVYQQAAAAAVQQLSALQQAQLAGSSMPPVLSQGMPLQMHHLANQQQSHGRGNYNTGSSGAMGKPAHSRMDGHSSGNRPSRFDQRDRRDERRERQRSPRRRTRSPPPRRRSRSPKVKSRSRSPRRKQRNIPRYSVTISPLCFDTESCSVLSVKSRYSNMYIPSDFFHLSMDWVKAFPLHRPFSLGHATKFHICHKDVTPLQPFPESVDPSDADYTYSAKVMLLAQPSLDDIYQQCCSLMEESREDEFIHPTRVLQFLVGMKAKTEPLAIGGPWSPSLDGADPANNPQVLINTAIRTTRNLTGVDLSTCTHWYRFVDISYLRAEETHKGKVIPEHTEHVVMFLPDIWSVVPAMMDYLSLQASYKHSLLVRLGDAEEPKKAEEKPVPQAAVEAEATAMETSQLQESATEEDEVNTSNVSADDENVEKPEATHWSKLDPKTMKVVELRTELEARSVSCKGLKTQLQAKLSKLLKTEMESEEEKEEVTEEASPVEEPAEEEKEAEKEPVAEPVTEPVAEPVAEPPELTPEEKEKKAKEQERLKAQLEKLYVFPEDPVILVHPNRSAKNGKFDCSLMSLSVLLDYRPEDNKEHSFEVSLFAESFNEMLLRDFGFTMYKKICAIPDEKKADDTPADKGDDSKPKEISQDDAKEKVEDESKSKEKSTDEQEVKEGDKSSEQKKLEDTEGSKDGKQEGSGKRLREKSAESESKKRRKDDEEDDDKSSVSGRSDRGIVSTKKKQVEKRKQVTVDRAGLLAFVYYDTTHAGYIMNKDLEDMIYTLGLQASRAQVRTLLQRACAGKESVTYRKLTDRPEPQPDEPSVETDLELDVVQLAQGNKGKVSECNAEAQVEDSNVITYRGAVLDLDKLISKMDRSETARLQVEKEMRIVQEEKDSLEGKLSRSEERVKKLNSDLKRTSDKLSSTKSERNRRENEVSSLKDVLHSTSRELHKVVKLVDGSLLPEVKERQSAEGCTPSRDTTPSAAESTTVGALNGESVGKSETSDSSVKREPMEDDAGNEESGVKAEDD